MKYTIKHGSIAACQQVTDENGKGFDLIYLRDSVTVEGVRGTEQDGVNRFNALPIEVRAAVNMQFGIVFSLPIEQRGEFCKNSQSFSVFGEAV